MAHENVIGFVFVFCAFAALIYEFLQKRFFPTRRPLTEAAKTDLIIFILGTYILAVTLRLDQIDRSLQDTLPSPSNQYDQSLRDYISFLRDGSKSGHITFSNHHESMTSLLRSIGAAQKSYDALNLYTTGWQGGMRELYDASVDAVRRKVDVWRCFVIREQYAPGEFEIQIKAMARQNHDGIHVYWVKESDLNKMPYFRENPLRSMALVDSEWLLVDTSPADRGDSPRGDSPSETMVTWVPAEVARNPFSQLKTYGYIKQFQEAELIKLKEESAKLDRAPR